MFGGEHQVTQYITGLCGMTGALTLTKLTISRDGSERNKQNHNTGTTVEPLLKDSPNKGHHINYLPTKDTF